MNDRAKTLEAPAIPLPEQTPSARPLTIALANSGRKWIGEIAHVAMLYEQLEKLGHRPWIICRKGYALEAHARAASWRRLALRFSGSFNPWLDGRDLIRWLDWARRRKPDIIHCHRGKDHWVGMAVAKIIRRPLVRTRHVVMPVDRHILNRWLYLRMTQAVISVSLAARKTFGPWQDRLPNGRVILSAVDAEKFHPRHRSQAWRREALSDGNPAANGAGEPLWFGCIGRLQSIKGQHIFIEAAARVAAQCPEARFLLAGDGSEGRRQRFANRAKSLGIGHKLLLAGYLSNLPEVLASLDVGVIASLGSEGSSRIGLEMLASGLPLVATKVGGIPDIAEPSGAAKLIDPGDPEAMAAAMLAWAGDPQARREAGENARRHILAAHDPVKWAEEILEVYRLAALSRNPSS